MNKKAISVILKYSTWGDNKTFLRKVKHLFQKNGICKQKLQISNEAEKPSEIETVRNQEGVVWEAKQEPCSFGIIIKLALKNYIGVSQHSLPYSV